jgi:hypothetical protein
MALSAQIIDPKNREETLHLDCHFVIVIILKVVEHLTRGIQIKRQQ